VIEIKRTMQFLQQSYKISRKSETLPQPDGRKRTGNLGENDYQKHRIHSGYFLAGVDILHLPGWQAISCQEDEDQYIIQAAPSSSVCACPQCGSSAIVEHARNIQFLRDLPVHAKQVLIQVDHLRFRCKQCKKTWVDPLPGIDERRFATSRLVRYVERQSLTKTFVALAAECGMDEKSVRNIFHDYIEQLEQTVQIETPEVMGMDELHLMGHPRGVITNVGNRSFVEMLPDRKKQSIRGYLTNLPNKDRIRVCVIDMWRPYLEALQEALPHVTIVIDKFHVVKQLNEIVETVRKEVRGTLSERQRRTLMHDRYLLLKRERDLEEKDRLIMESWFATFPRLGAVHACKEAFYSIYDASTQEEALSRYFDWIELVKQRDVYDAFLELLLTVENWGDYIFAYFQERYTGGFVEAANGIGRVIDRQGRGYSFDVLRARLLYGQSLRQRTKRRERMSVDGHSDAVPVSTLA